MRAACPGGLDDLRLVPAEAPEPTGPDEGGTVVEGRAYRAEPPDGPGFTWSVTPMAEDPWPGRVEWALGYLLVMERHGACGSASFAA